MFPLRFNGLYNLKKLIISKCGIKQLPAHINCLINLNILIIVNCIELEHIPEQLGSLVELKELYISNCNNLSHIPMCIGFCFNLESIHIFNNKIIKNADNGRLDKTTIYIPESVILLKNLKKFRFNSGDTYDIININILLSQIEAYILTIKDYKILNYQLYNSIFLQKYTEAQSGIITPYVNEDSHRLTPLKSSEIDKLMYPQNINEFNTWMANCRTQYKNVLCVIPINIILLWLHYDNICREFYYQLSKDIIKENSSKIYPQLIKPGLKKKESIEQTVDTHIKIGYGIYKSFITKQLQHTTELLNDKCNSVLDKVCPTYLLKKLQDSRVKKNHHLITIKSSIDIIKP